MLEKVKFAIGVVILLCLSFVCGWCFASFGARKLEGDILELTKRNKSLSARIISLEERSRRDAEQSTRIAKSLGVLVEGLNGQVERASRIADRARRIDELARLLDKGLSEIIEEVRKLQTSYPSDGGGSGS